MKRKQELANRGQELQRQWSMWRLELLRLCEEIRAEWLAARRAAGFQCRAPSEVLIQPKKELQSVIVSELGLVIRITVGPDEPAQRLDQLETRLWDCGSTLRQWIDVLNRAKQMIEQKDLVALAARVD